VCRFAAYLGAAIDLGDLMDRPEHGLVHQAWAPREMATATMNADGVGAGWYDDAGQTATYRNVMPAWADVNLEPLGRSLRRDLWFAYVRSATSGFATGAANTQPFATNGLLFLHNGFIEGFGESLRPTIRAALSPAVENGIHGTTDSEYLFAVLREYYRVPGTNLANAVRQTLALATSTDCPALLNIAVTDGERIVVARHALHKDCPGLYIHRSVHWGGGPGVAVASEPLNAEPGWQPIAAHRLWLLARNRDPVEESL